jgi:archaemetzincin
MSFVVVAVSFLTLVGKDKSMSVAIQPLGSMPANSVAAVRRGLESTYGVRVTVLKSVALPKEAYYSPRGRYRAEKLLTFLARTPGSYDKVLGLTARDISTTKDGHKDWGLFGLGQMPGKACVLSSFRLKRKGPKTTNQRLTEVAIHELGHTLGLAHCPTPRCVMADAAGSIKTVDISTGKPCRKCWEQLE